MTIKQGDTYPTLRATLTDANGNAVNLTSATVTFRMTNAAGEAVIADRAVSITNAAAGEVEFSWLAADTDTPGEYKGEIKAVLGSGSIVTFPNDSYIDIRILINLAAAPAVSSDLITVKTKPTNEGGLAVLLTNRTGGVSVIGAVVRASRSYDNAVEKIEVDVPDPVGVIYESGIADGDDVWVVVSGVADVLFVSDTTRGYLARGFLTADGGSYISGYALAEAVPTSPFATDKHFYEIGHVLQNRTGAGLARCLLHFN